VAKKKDEEEDGDEGEVDNVTLDMLRNIDIIEQRHKLIIENLTAQLARQSEINKENKATLNKELDYPEHAMLSITSASKTYRDSSENYELVLSHLVQFYEKYVSEMDAMGDVKKVSQKYENQLSKYRAELLKLASYRAAVSERMLDLNGQIANYKEILSKNKIKEDGSPDLLKDSEGIERERYYDENVPHDKDVPHDENVPQKTAPLTSGQQNVDVSNGPISTGTNTPTLGQTDHNTLQSEDHSIIQKRRRGRPTKTEEANTNDNSNSSQRV